MKRVPLYLIIYIQLFGGLCSCERLDIPLPDEETEEDVTPSLPEQDVNNDVRDGSRESPYTVAHAQAIGDEYFEVEDAWIEGYIVGWISGSHYPNPPADEPC